MTTPTIRCPLCEWTYTVPPLSGGVDENTLAGVFGPGVMLRSAINRRAADIERREREQREAEEQRKAQLKAELDRKAAEAAQERKRQEAAEALRRRISELTAEDIVRWIASELGCEWGPVAARIAAIPHQDWIALTHTSESP